MVRTTQTGRIGLIAVILGAMIAAAPHAGAAEFCDEPSVADRLPKPPDGCQREFISASGNQRPTMTWAQKSAEDHWQDQVLNKYGERFGRWTYAACPKVDCGPASIAGFARCTYGGYPCATKPYVESELGRDEIREMQRLLKKHGFATKIDGVFGPNTHEALRRWQRSEKLGDDGLPTRYNLERLRQA
jgi:hypothetical protein